MPHVRAYAVHLAANPHCIPHRRRRAAQARVCRLARPKLVASVSRMCRRGAACPRPHCHSVSAAEARPRVVLTRVTVRTRFFSSFSTVRRRRRRRTMQRLTKRRSEAATAPGKRNIRRRTQGTARQGRDAAWGGGGGTGTHDVHAQHCHPHWTAWCMDAQRACARTVNQHAAQEAGTLGDGVETAWTCRHAVKDAVMRSTARAHTGRRPHGVRAAEATSEKENAACARGRARVARTMITWLRRMAGQARVGKDARERAMRGCVHLQRCSARASAR